MKGLRMLGGGRVAVETFPDPEPAPGGALVRIQASGLCGSELHGYRADHAQSANAGHEAMGVVVETRGTARLKAGDRVGLHAVWGCGKCDWCAQGRYTWCQSKLGPSPFHAEYVAAPEHVLLPLADDISDPVGVLLSGDGLGVPWHVQTRLRTAPGDLVVIVGCGPIGLGNTLVQVDAGAEVIAVELTEYRLSLARAMGAAHTVNPNLEDAVNAVARIAAGRQVRTSIEAVGKPETLRLCLKLVGLGGTVMAVGEQPATPVDISEELIRRDITLMGSWFFHFREFADMAAAYRAGLAVDRLVTHSFALDEAGKGFAEFAAGRTGKAMLVP
jgi:threonine dehydrogenase-like Zn-dependent dehydrogenase